MRNRKQTEATRRAIGYVAVVLALLAAAVLVHGSKWKSSAEFHTLMELGATILALFVGGCKTFCVNGLFDSYKQSKGRSYGIGWEIDRRVACWPFDGGRDRR
jgi:hypothetical protein